MFGLDVICENADVLADNDRVRADVGETRRWGRLSFGSDPRGPLEQQLGSEGRDDYLSTSFINFPSKLS